MVDKYKTKILIFGCENGDREIPSRIAFAGLAASRGWTSIVAHKDIADGFVGAFTSGVYVYKNTHAPALTRFGGAKKQGFFTIAVEEETLGVQSEYCLDSALHVGNMLDENVCKYIDIFVAGNKSDARIFHENKNIKDDLPCLAIGNLRTAYAQLFSSVPRIEDGKKSCLINGRLGLITGPVLWNQFLFLKNIGWSLADSVESLRSGLLREFDLMLEIDSAINSLSDFDVRWFRTHPAESGDYYTKFYGDSISLQELSTGPMWFLMPYIDLVVGFSCTTLIESLLAGRHVRNFGGLDAISLADACIDKRKDLSLEDLPAERMDLLRDELYLQGDIFNQWLEMLEALPVNEVELNLGAIRIPEWKPVDYSRQRFGGYDLNMANQDIRLMAERYKLKDQPKVGYADGLFIVQPSLS